MPRLAFSLGRRYCAGRHVEKEERRRSPSKQGDSADDRRGISSTRSACEKMAALSLRDGSRCGRYMFADGGYDPMSSEDKMGAAPL